MGFLTIFRLSRHRLEEVASQVRRAEAAGYDSIGVQEDTHDSLLTAVKVTDATSTLQVETRVTICFPRSPMITAYNAWDLQDYSRGRFQLGLGTQVKGHNLRRYSTPWSSPGPRLREYILSLHAIWDCFQDGAPLNFQGDHYQFNLMAPAWNPGPISYPRPRVYIGAVGPYNCRLAGELCDGAILHTLHSATYVRDFMRPHILQGAKKAGRDPKEVKISGGGFVATGANKQEVKAMAEEVRRRIAFHASARTYTPILAATGWKEVVDRLHALSLEGKWDEMGGQVSDEMLNDFAILGEYDEVAGKIKERFGGLVDEVAPDFSSPGPIPLDIERRIIEELKT